MSLFLVFQSSKLSGLLSCWLGNPFYEASDVVPFDVETNYPDVVSIQTLKEENKTRDYHGIFYIQVCICLFYAVPFHTLCFRQHLVREDEILPCIFKLYYYWMNIITKGTQINVLHFLPCLFHLPGLWL